MRRTSSGVSGGVARSALPVRKIRPMVARGPGVIVNLTSCCWFSEFGWVSPSTRARNRPSFRSSSRICSRANATFSSKIAVAQTELRGVRQTDGTRRGSRALHGDQPDEPARAGLENHLEAAFDLLALRLDVFVAASGVKLVDAFGYRAGVERLARANGDNLPQVILGQRLATWYEVDLDHGRPGSGTGRRGAGRRSRSTGRQERRQQENLYQYQNYRTCLFHPWLWADVSSITLPLNLGLKAASATRFPSPPY